MVFISNKSVTKRGYVQREIRLALEKAEEKLVDDIYLIPVLLDDDVVVPTLVKDLQFIRATDESFEHNILDAINHQLERVGVAIEALQSDSDIKWHFYNHTESKDGLPGYEGELRLIKLSSDRYPLVPQIADVIRGDLLGQLMGLRETCLDQLPDAYNFGQDRFRRTNTLHAHPQNLKIRGRMLSISYGLYSYFAGAAHPHEGIVTYDLAPLN